MKLASMSLNYNCRNEFETNLQSIKRSKYKVVTYKYISFYIWQYLSFYGISFNIFKLHVKLETKLQNLPALIIQSIV